MDLRDKMILDIGCNDAVYTVELAQFAKMAVGVDIEDERLEKASHRVKERPLPICLSVMSGERIGFPDGTFDLVFINEALEHIPDQNSALDEIHRVLNEHGRFILFAPNRFYPFETHGARIGRRKFGRFIPIIHWLPRVIGRHFMNARSYTPKELEALLAGHGLQIIHQSFLFPPLDGLRTRLDRYNLAGIIDVYRRVITAVKRTPILGSMGLSIFVVAARIEDIP